MSDNEERQKEAHGSENGGTQCDDIKKLKIEFQGLKDSYGKLSNLVAEHGKKLEDILEFQGGTKVYVQEIKEQLSSVETKLFTFMGDLVKQLTKKEEKAGQNWMDLVKYILLITLGAIVTYIFKQ
jgi:uncharacterized protein Yka (UPF0111/DUF47 family)